MKLTDELYDLTLAWASGELDQNQPQSLDAAPQQRVAELAELWQSIEAIVIADDELEPSPQAIAQATAIPFGVRSHKSLHQSVAAAAKATLQDLLDQLDGVMARLVHDDRLTPLAVRGEAAQVVHMAWEAGELDIDLVAEPSALDPLTGQSSSWVLRGQVMTDLEIGKVDATLVDSATRAVVSSTVIDRDGRFVLSANAGSWCLRIGASDRGLHLEPVELA